MLKRVISRFFVAIMLANSSLIYANDSKIQFHFGNDFLRNCGQLGSMEEQKFTQDQLRSGLCFGYFNGMNDYMAYRSDGDHCFPAGASRAQGMDVFLKFLRDNPEIRNRPTPELLVLAYQAAFPCDTAGS